MLSKANILKIGAVVVILSGGVYFALLGQAMLKAKSASTAVSEPKTKTFEAYEPADAAVEINEAALKVERQAIAVKSDLNDYVLRVIPSYNGGKYPYLLNNDYENYNGVTENIFYKGEIIAKANPNRSKSSHCVGLTYEVFFKAMQQRNKEAGIALDNFNNMNVDNMKDFLLTWYAAKPFNKTEGNQLTGAIVKYGLGTRITKLEDARPGDFIDFSRTKSGHTAVLISWLRDDKGNIAGFKYWSTQESTNGIGYREEYFSDNSQEAFKGTVNRSQFYIGRVGAISNYKAF